MNLFNFKRNKKEVTEDEILIEEGLITDDGRRFPIGTMVTVTQKNTDYNPCPKFYEYTGRIDGLLTRWTPDQLSLDMAKQYSGRFRSFDISRLYSIAQQGCKISTNKNENINRYRSLKINGIYIDKDEIITINYVDTKSLEKSEFCITGRVICFDNEIRLDVSTEYYTKTLNLNLSNIKNIKIVKQQEESGFND